MRDDSDLIAHTVEVVASFVSHNRLPPEAVAAFIRSTHAAITAIGHAEVVAPAAASAPREPAISIRKSLASPDHIVSLIDGKPYKSLKRHLRAHGLTPDDYRAHFGLKPDYPMVAPTYAEGRRAIALSFGLGRKRAPGRTLPPDTDAAVFSGSDEALRRDGRDTAAIAGEPVSPAMAVTPVAGEAAGAAGGAGAPIDVPDATTTDGKRSASLRRRLSISL